MKYAIAFFLAAIGCIFLAGKVKLWAWLLLWYSISFIAVGIGYAGAGAKVFGKQTNGKIALLAIILLLPYLLLIWLSWHLYRWLSKETACQQITENIWLGRRALIRELPENITLIVDLTAEFIAPKNIYPRKYLCLPTLDASVPEEGEMLALIERLISWDGNIYIHCALGTGRSAMAVAAIILAKGLAANAAQAEAMVQKIRPHVQLNRPQQRFLAKIAKKLPRA